MKTKILSRNILRITKDAAMIDADIDAHWFNEINHNHNCKIIKRVRKSKEFYIGYIVVRLH